MLEVLVVADDLTGANDTAVQFSRYGCHVMVITDLSQADQVPADVLVIDTESRHLDREGAYKVLEASAEVCLRRQPRCIYKKIDSTLRGNIGSEIDALMNTLMLGTAVMIPAMPSTGRQTIGGYQLLHGVPLQKTDLARDPLNPVTESYIPALLGRQTKRTVSRIPLLDVLEGTNKLAESLRLAAVGNGEIIVVDAASSDDLDMIADALQQTDLLRFTIGPADFAARLGKALSKQPKNQGPVLTVVGSVNQASLAQADFLSQQPSVTTIVIKGEELLDAQHFERLAKQVESQVLEAVAGARDMLLRTASSREDVKSTVKQGSNYGLSEKETAERVAERLGILCAQIVRHGNLRNLIMTGGDIAIATYKALGLEGVQIVQEVLPGIPYGTVLNGPWQGMKVITKAGAFGDRQALWQCIRFLKR